MTDRQPKIGDEVLVTYRGIVNDVGMSFGVKYRVGEGIIRHTLDAESVEVIERPLAVGDRVVARGDHGELLAIHGDMAWVKWDVQTLSTCHIGFISREVSE